MEGEIERWRGGRQGWNVGGGETKGSGSTQGRRPRAADVSVCVFSCGVGVNGSVRERLPELVLLPP